MNPLWSSVSQMMRIQAVQASEGSAQGDMRSPQIEKDLCLLHYLLPILAFNWAQQCHGGLRQPTVCLFFEMSVSYSAAFLANVQTPPVLCRSDL